MTSAAAPDPQLVDALIAISRTNSGKVMARWMAEQMVSVSTAPAAPPTDPLTTLAAAVAALVADAIPQPEPAPATTNKQAKALAATVQHNRTSCCQQLGASIARQAGEAYQQGMQALMGEVFAGAGYSPADHEWQERVLRLIDRHFQVRRLLALLAQPQPARNPDCPAAPPRDA